MEKEYSKGRLFATLFALGISGGSIFIIPYIKFVFYDLQIQVTGMTNTESALLLTVYSIASLVLDIPGGMICDKIDSKKGLLFALLCTTLVTLIYAFVNTSFIISMIIWAILAFTTMAIYWPIFSKVLNILGKKTGVSGRAGATFGWYYAFNGISAAILQAIALWASTQFATPVANFRAAIFVAAGSTLLATILVMFLFDKDMVAPTPDMASEMITEKKNSKFDLSQLGTVLKMPMVWAIMLVCMIAYCMYSMMSYFTPYLTAVVGVSPSASGAIAIIRTYVFLILALVGGTIADRVFKGTAKWIMIVFIACACIIGGLLLLPKGSSAMFVSIYTLLPAALVQMSYPIKYSVIGEVGINPYLFATVTGLAAFFGALPDLILGPIIGSLLDSRGNDAYTILFIILIVLLIIGAVCAYAIVRHKKNIVTE